MSYLKEFAKNAAIAITMLVGIMVVISTAVITVAASFALAEILYNSIKEGAMTCL